jgi:hypothetical protein
MESPLIEGHWYKITPLDENNVYKYYIGKLIETSVPPKSNVQMAYFEGVVRKNTKKGSYTEMREQNFVMGSYAYTEPTEGEVLYAKSLFGDGELPKGPATYKGPFTQFLSLYPPRPYGPPSVGTDILIQSPIEPPVGETPQNENNDAFQYSNLGGKRKTRKHKTYKKKKRKGKSRKYKKRI